MTVGIGEHDPTVAVLAFDLGVDVSGFDEVIERAGGRRHALDE